MVVISSKLLEWGVSEFYRECAAYGKLLTAEKEVCSHLAEPTTVRKQLNLK
jgi:hypothetical protein